MVILNWKKKTNKHVEYIRSLPATIIQWSVHIAIVQMNAAKTIDMVIRNRTRRWNRYSSYKILRSSRSNPPSVDVDIVINGMMNPSLVFVVRNINKSLDIFERIFENFSNDDVQSTAIHFSYIWNLCFFFRLILMFINVYIHNYCTRANCIFNDLANSSDRTRLHVYHHTKQRQKIKSAT